MRGFNFLRVLVCRVTIAASMDMLPAEIEVPMDMLPAKVEVPSAAQLSSVIVMPVFPEPLLDASSMFLLVMLPSLS